MTANTPPPATGRDSGLPERCTTPGCGGDVRYAAPGRSHIEGCTYPTQPPAPQAGASVEALVSIIDAHRNCTHGGSDGVRLEWSCGLVSEVYKSLGWRGEHIAAAVLASDWLAQRDAAVRAEVVKAILDAAPPLNSELLYDGREDPVAAAYVEGFHDAYEAARTTGGDR